MLGRDQPARRQELVGTRKDGWVALQAEVQGPDVAARGGIGGAVFVRQHDVGHACIADAGGKEAEGFFHASGHVVVQLIER